MRLGGAGLGLLVPSGWCLGVVHGCGVAWFEGVCGWEGGGVTEFREALARATVLLGELAHLDRSVLSDADLVVLLEAEEAAGRLVDAIRVFTAAEIAERSRHELGMEGLSSRYSHRKPVDFIEYRARVSKAEAARRVRVGAALRARRSLLGESLPAERPVLAVAVRDGRVGVEAAGAIITHLKQAATGCEATVENMDAAEAALTEVAVTSPVAEVSDLARAWRDGLDPDGIEPRWDDILRQRGVTIGREHGGLKTYTITAAPPLAAVLDAALIDPMDHTGPRFLPAEDRAHADPSDTDPTDESGEQAGRPTTAVTAPIADPRTLAQKQYDILEAVFTAGLNATRTGEADYRTTGTVTAIISLTDLLANTTPTTGRGYGILEGIEEIIPARVIQQLACDTGITPLVVGARGEPLWLGRTTRYITPAQRRALIARDGDRCIATGCRKRAAQCHGHHVIFNHHGGPTNIDNAVLLCPAHHTALHQGAFEIRMINALPYLRDSIDATNNNAWQPASHNRLTPPHHLTATG